jgi:hypothetical protein
MKYWTLVYCFTKKLSKLAEGEQDKNFNIILDCLKKSVQLNSKFHKLKLYTDDFTYNFVKDINIDIKVIDYSRFRFLDDIKIQTLPLLEEDEVLIDPDIFLYDELKIDEKCDLILERTYKISLRGYRKSIKQSKPFKFSKLLDFSTKTGKVGNIGIIKFINTEFMLNYIYRYNNVRKVAMQEEDKLLPFPHFSVLLGELLLTNVADDFNYKVGYCRLNKKNNYKHLSGKSKYRQMQILDRKTDKNNSLI